MTRFTGPETPDGHQRIFARVHSNYILDCTQVESAARALEREAEILDDHVLAEDPEAAAVLIDTARTLREIAQGARMSPHTGPRGWPAVAVMVQGVKSAAPAIRSASFTYAAVCDLRRAAIDHDVGAAEFQSIARLMDGCGSLEDVRRLRPLAELAGLPWDHIWSGVER